MTFDEAGDMIALLYSQLFIEHFLDNRYHAMHCI